MRNGGVTNSSKGKKLYNWIKGLNVDGGKMSRNRPIMDEMNQTLRYLYTHKDIDLNQLVGFGEKIGSTGKYTDILKKSKPRYVELKSVKEGIGPDDFNDEINVLSGLNKNPLKNRKQFVEQFINGYLKDISSLDELIYVFDANKLGANGEAFIKGQFKELFESKADEIFNAKPEIFKQIDRIGGGKIRNLTDFENLLKNKDFTINHPIFKFIIIE